MSQFVVLQSSNKLASNLLLLLFVVLFDSLVGLKLVAFVCHHTVIGLIKIIRND